MSNSEKNGNSGRTVRLPAPFVGAFDAEVQRLIDTRYYTDKGVTAAASLILFLAVAQPVRQAAINAVSSFGADPEGSKALVRTAIAAEAGKRALERASQRKPETPPAHRRKGNEAG